MRSSPLAPLALVLALPVAAQDAQGPPPEPKIELPGIQKLRIGGQYRLRYENFVDYDFDSNATDDDDFFGQRVRIDFDFTINDRMSVFVQVQDVRFFGETSSTIARTAPGLDLHQGWLEVRDLPWSGADVRLGRQILSYGEERIIGALEWLNQGRSFDGMRLRFATGEHGDLDVFAVQLREDLVTLNRRDDAVFFGAYWAMKSAKNQLDLYVLGLHDDLTGLGDNENRFTIGARGILGGDHAEFGAELVTQFGDVDSADIPLGKTFGVHAHAKLRPGDGDVWLQADFDAASGDDPGTADNERFDTLFSTAHKHLGIMDFVFFENLTHGSLTVGMQTAQRSGLELSWRFFRAQETADRVFGPQGTLSNGGLGIDPDLGQELNLIFHHDFDATPAKASVEVGYGLFVPGVGVQDARGGDDLAHFLYVQGDVRF